MNYSEQIIAGLKAKRISITKAAKWLGMTRQNFYNRLESGDFKVSEINKLVAKGIIKKQKLFTIEQVGEYLLTQPNLDAAIMNLEEDKL